MNDMLVPSHLGEHQRLKDVTRYAATVVRTILEGWFTFDSVLDVGCGTGNWLDCFSANRDRTIFGLEMETYAPADLAIDPRLILHVDLGHEVDLRRRFDLVLCLEVAEHIDRACAATVVANCARHADVVLFSAAIPGQRGLHHVNEQTPGYWSDLFAGHDYEAIDTLRPLIWEDQQIPVWYRQNMLLFVRRGGAAHAEIQRRMPEPHEPRPRALAHPEYLAAFSRRIDDLLAETAALRDDVFAQRQKTDDAVGELRLARRAHQGGRSVGGYAAGTCADRQLDGVAGVQSAAAQGADGAVAGAAAGASDLDGPRAVDAVAAGGCGAGCVSR